MMNTQTWLIAAGALLLSGSLAIAAESPQAPGKDGPATGGKGPGMGHDYRRNVGGPGLGPASNAPPAPRHPQPLDDAVPAAPQAPAAARPPGLGYPGYPRQAPGMMAPFGNPGPGTVVPRRQGYGYPGYRGRGWSPYPGHYQYGNPPGLPPAPPRPAPQPAAAE
jgi:hypothetical protein